MYVSTLCGVCVSLFGYGGTGKKWTHPQNSVVADTRPDLETVDVEECKGRKKMDLTDL